MSSSFGTSASSLQIPSSSALWCLSLPDAEQEEDGKREPIPWWQHWCLGGCAIPPHHCSSGWTSWTHSSDGSWRLKNGSTSCRHSPSLEQEPLVHAHPDVGRSPQCAQVGGMAGPGVGARTCRLSPFCCRQSVRNKHVWVPYKTLKVLYLYFNDLCDTRNKNQMVVNFMQNGYRQLFKQTII